MICDFMILRRARNSVYKTGRLIIYALKQTHFYEKCLPYLMGKTLDHKHFSLWMDCTPIKLDSLIVFLRRYKYFIAWNSMN